MKAVRSVAELVVMKGQCLVAMKAFCWVDYLVVKMGENSVVVTVEQKGARMAEMTVVR